MGTATLLPMPRSVFFDANGKPLAGGAIATFIPGGTTPKTTWQDAAETIPNSNPIVLDSAGSCLLYGEGAYQLAVSDALGNAIPAYSGVCSIPTNFTTVNVAAYGALGNGTHDDAAAINAAIAACVAAGGGVVSFPAGNFIVGSTIVLQTHVRLEGAGRGITVLKGLAGTTMDLVQTLNFAGLVGTNTAGGPYQFGMANMSLNGNSRAGGRCASFYGYAYILDDVEFFGAAGDGFYSEWCTSGLVPVTAGGNSMEAQINRTSYFSNGGNGITFRGPHDTILTNCFSFLNTGIGALFQQSATYIGACVINTFHSYGNQQVGVQTNTSLYVSGLQSENNRATGGIFVQSPAGQLNGSNIIVFENTGFGIRFDGNSSSVAAIFSYANSTDGVAVIGLNNILSDISSTNNGNDGLIINPGATGTTIDGLISSSNTSVGISLQSNDVRIRNIFATFNGAGGLTLANGLGNLSLSGELNNNTGTQAILGPLGNDCIIELNIYTVTPQVAWSGTMGANNVSIIAIGYDARTLETFGGDIVSGGSLIVANNVQAGTGTNGGGYVCRAGKTGAFSASDFNIYWTGSATQLWIDNSNLGSISVTSDERYKQAIAPLADGALDRVLSLRPVSYRWQDKGIFRDDGAVREGLLAQQVRALIPSAVEGDPNQDELLSLNLAPVLSVLIKAVQELAGQVGEARAAAAARPATS